MATVNTILGSLYVDDRGEPDEPTALLWPSLFTDHSMWRHQIAPLREAGWRTLALDPPGLRLEAVVVGGPMRVGFAPALLRAALEASVGPEVMLELSEPNRPVLVRSADQGTFTTLVMPHRLDHHG